MSSKKQDTSPKRHSTKQLPTIIPLPVFRFTGPASPPAFNNSENLNETPLNSRRNTLASIILGRRASPRRSKSFGQSSLHGNSDEQTKERDFVKRNSLPCAGHLSVLNEKKVVSCVANSEETPPPSEKENQASTRASIKRKTFRASSSSKFEKEPSVMSLNENGYKRGRSIMLNKTSKSKQESYARKTGSHHLSIPSPGGLGGDEGELNNHELDLLHFSAEGNLQGLEEIFRQQAYYLYPINVNCVDTLDRTALSLATLNRHLDVVKFLLGDDIHGLILGDALFYAIQCEFYDAIELLLEKDPQTTLQVLPGTTSPFEPGLTPFMLAAHRNNYKILSMLYKYSHRLTFSDNELLLDEGFDPYSWDAVMERLLHYRARASPAFMLLMFNEKGMSWDPLNSAMDLFGELHELAKREREVDESYLQMAERCETFAMELLEEVRSASELADFMRYDLEEDVNLVDDGDDNANESLTSEKRMKLRHYLKPIEKAVKYEMKDFVTSDNSQLALIYIQKGSLFRRLKGVKATLVEIFLGLMFPFLCIAFLIAPKSSIGSLMQNPTVKFWCWLVSEVVFVLILLTNTLLTQAGLFEGLDAIPPLLAIAYFWIVGKFIQEVREIKHQGLREYLTDIWNWNDMFTIFFYTAFMILRLVHLFVDGSKSRSGTYWNENTLDPLPLSDICIAVSYILIHMRIMELLRAERTFGPLQVSLDLMLHDAFRFLIIFCIVFLAFGSGITELYTPYGDGKKCICNATTLCNSSLPLVDTYPKGWYNKVVTEDSGDKPPCVSCKKHNPKAQQMTTFLSTLNGLFWTMFGYGHPETWYMLSNCEDHKHGVQELAGGVIIGMYHFGAIIVLVNMLIAMMSNSFQKTHDDSEREWKFHRTQLWLKFIRNEINRPPPMNLIPRWKVVKAFLKNLQRLCCWRCRKQARSDAPNGDLANAHHIPLQRRADGLSSDQMTGSLFEGETKYCKVLRLVVLRYVKHKVLHSEMVM